MSIVKDLNLRKDKEFIQSHINDFLEEDLDEVNNLYDSLNIDNAEDVLRQTVLLHNKAIDLNREIIERERISYNNSEEMKQFNIKQRNLEFQNNLCFAIYIIVLVMLGLSV